MSLLQHNHESASNPEKDGKPRFGIGHISITAKDVDVLTNFYTAIGMRPVVNMGGMAIVELRGGTHLIIRSGEPGVASLDLIVDDIDETRTVLEANGTSPSVIQRGNPHDRFIATDPEGNTIIVNSDHSIGVV